MRKKIAALLPMFSLLIKTDAILSINQQLTLRLRPYVMSQRADCVLFLFFFLQPGRVTDRTMTDIDRNTGEVNFLQNMRPF